MTNRALLVTILAGAVCSVGTIASTTLEPAPSPQPGAVGLQAQVSGDVLARDQALAWSCQDASGNCCLPNETPGCDDFACCSIVCAEDDWCCNVEWDDVCAAWAIIYCDPSACEESACPGEGGDCCAANGTPGCAPEWCCEYVCDYDSFCCDDAWDAQCAEHAGALCGDLCLPPPVCPGEGGDCCTANGTPGCQNGCCCVVVCEQDRDCCDTAWTADCAQVAQSLCGGLCGDPYPGCPGDGDCFSANFSPGCEDAFCCSMVCAQDDLCCSEEWDYTCAGIAEDVCNCPVSLCPGDGGLCCQANGTSGCDDLECCELVCHYDPLCCSVDGGWDGACVWAAEDLCGTLCACRSFADFDDDGLVDMADFARFQNCFTGSTAALDDGCACGNFDEDGHVDWIDYQAFYAALTTD